MAGSKIKCFIARPTPMVQLSLRRYVTGSKCEASGMGIHNAMNHVEVAPAIFAPGTHGILDSRPERYSLTDERWPERCVCGYYFQLDDVYQVFQDRIYQDDHGKQWCMRDLPPGAMYDAYWMPSQRRGPDGWSLVVIVPGKPPTAWNVDDQRWKRHGQLPRITVTPSIQTSDYHGWLTDGELVPC